MAAPPRSALPLLLMLLLFAAGLALLRTGFYGWTLFVVLPVALGGLTALVFCPAARGTAFRMGARTTAAAACLLLVFGWEGLVCILLALPLVVPLGALGALLVYELQSGRFATRGFAMLLLLPLATLSWDAKAKPPVFAVRTAIEVAASPEQVWKHVVAFAPLPEPREWYFRAGVAYPQRAHIDGAGLGAVRYCEFSTGSFVEPIEIWDEPRLLRFRVTDNPAPLREWSPYSEIQPKHLHGYLLAKQGEFRLSRLPNGYTLLQGTTWYQHGLWPAAYWRWWSDAIIHRIHLRVLNHVRVLAEQESRLTVQQQ